MITIFDGEVAIEKGKGRDGLIDEIVYALLMNASKVTPGNYHILIEKIQKEEGR